MNALTLTRRFPGANGDGQVVQRNQLTGRTGISLEGTYSLTVMQGKKLVGVNARVMPAAGGAAIVPWTPLTQVKVEGSSWSGIFHEEVPAGHWYLWELEAINEAGEVYAAVNPSDRWGVGDIIAFAGQSNIVDLVASEFASTVTVATDDGASVYARGFTWSRIGELDIKGDGAGGRVAAAHGMRIVNGAYVSAGRQVISVGAFTTYTFNDGDEVFIYLDNFGDALDFKPKSFKIAGKTDANIITLDADPELDNLPDGVTGLTSQSRTNGMHEFAKHLRASYVEEGDDVPIGVVLAGTDGSAIKWDADYIAVGHWLGANASAYNVFLAALKLAANDEQVRARAIIWQQGEAEGTAANFTGPLNPIRPARFVPDVGYYRAALKELIAKMSADISGVNGPPVYVIGTVGPNAQTNALFGLNSAHASSYEVIRQDQIRVALEDGHGLCALHGTNMEADLLHYSIAGAESFGQRAAETLAGTYGRLTRSKTGPRIIKAITGDYVTAGAGIPTPTQVRSLNHITLTVQHELGDDLVLPSNPHVSFEVQDEHGPVYVSAVTKGLAAVAVGGTQLILLTLERDTAQTEGVDRPFKASKGFIGAIGFVRYGSFVTLQDNGAPRDRFIFDNAAKLAMPLLTTHGFDAPRYAPHNSSAVNDYTKIPSWTDKVLICGIDNVTNLAASQITLDAPTTAFPGGWTVVAGAATQIRPGDRCIFEAAGGAYIGEATIRKVIDYTDENTTVDIELSHDMTGEAPTDAAFCSVYTNSRSAGTIVCTTRGTISTES